MQEKPEEDVTALNNEVTETDNANASNEIVEPEVENTQSTEVPEGTEEQPTEPATEVEPVAQNTVVEETFSEAQILEKFDNICESIEELVIMAKEGHEHRNEVILKALDSGVHSMGNAFKKDIFTKTFSNMATKDIEEMGKAWEEEADSKFAKDKVSKQEFSNDNEVVELRVDMKQFKTGIY